MKPKISVIIPCYNEENNIKQGILGQVYQFLSTQTFDWEVLICNDDSTDNSPKLIKEQISHFPGFRLINLPHGGKPSALFGGIQQAKYPWVLLTDMDQSTPIKEIHKLLPYLDSHDIVIGSRGNLRQGHSIIRKIGSYVFTNIRMLIMLHHIVDTQCGFKAVKTTVAKKIFPLLAAVKTASQTVGWRVSSYDVEMLYIADKWKLKIKEVLVNWKNEDLSTTKGDFITRYRKESVQMAKEVVRVKFSDLRGLYPDKFASDDSS